MPYISPEQVKAKRKAIKKAFPGWKFSIRCKNYSSININILKAPLDFAEYEQVNHYYIEEHFEGEQAKALKKIYEIANSDNDTEVYDGDYGRIPNFYVHIQIGRWDKPFQKV